MSTHLLSAASIANIREASGNPGLERTAPAVFRADVLRLLGDHEARNELLRICARLIFSPAPNTMAAGQDLKTRLQHAGIPVSFTTGEGC